MPPAAFLGSVSSGELDAVRLQGHDVSFDGVLRRRCADARLAPVPFARSPVPGHAVNLLHLVKELQSQLASLLPLASREVLSGHAELGLYLLHQRVYVAEVLVEGLVDPVLGYACGREQAGL